jgi:hypothetical protein
MRLTRDRGELLAPATAAMALLVAGCLSAAVVAQRSAVDTDSQTPSAGERGALDGSVPAPRSVIGHEIGDGAVRYDALVRYLRALSESSPLVTLTPTAQTHEGRTLYYLTITSAENHARLERIREDAAKLADPRRLNDGDEADRIVETLPGIAWLAYSIHGDELSSSDAAIEVAYRLAAGTEASTRRLREDLVIHIDPLQNPDGRERYLNQLESLTGKVANTDYQSMQHSGLWSAGRGNHYLFDLNRDWVMQVQPETRGRARAILAWNPHLAVDSHEMGPLDTYLFDPPREPFNVNLSPGTLTWRRRFSADQARVFDAQGWSYYTREWYEEWYPGYTNAWASLLGAVGMLYEQAGVNAAAVKQPAGNTLTYAEAVRHQVASTFANLSTLQENRREILRDYLEDRKWAVSADRSGRQGLLVAPPADRARLDRLLEVLKGNGIEFGFAATVFSANDVTSLTGQEIAGKTFDEGTLVVRAAQPHRRLLTAALEFDPRMSTSFVAEERKELESRRGTRLYDITAWNVCMALGLECHWADHVGDVSLASERPQRPAPVTTDGAYGYLIDGADSRHFAAVVDLLGRDRRVRVAEKPFRMLGREFPAGTVLLRRHENGNDLDNTLDEVARKHSVVVQPVGSALSEDGPDLGGGHFRLLVPPRIAVANQWPISSTSFGSIWHLLDARVGVRCSPINLQAIGRIDLRPYNVLVLPGTWGVESLSAILTEGVRQRLRDWIEAGGTLVAIGGSAAFAAGADRNLSAVRLVRDVLDKREVYEEAVRRERAARDVQIDAKRVWGEASTEGTAGAAGSPDRSTGTEAGGNRDSKRLAREDEWQRLFSPFGVMAAADMDAEHWLTFGLESVERSSSTIPVFLTGSFAFASRHPVQTPVRLAQADRIRLSGLFWPEARERWADTAFVTVERVGHGQIILFATDPIFRGYFEGTGRILLNAVILGPGMGTSQPVPW